MFLEALQANMTANCNSKPGPSKELLDEFASSVHTVQADLSEEKRVVDMFATTAQSRCGAVQIAMVNHRIWVTADVSVVIMTSRR